MAWRDNLNVKLVRRRGAAKKFNGEEASRALQQLSHRMIVRPQATGCQNIDAMKLSPTADWIFFSSNHGAVPPLCDTPGFEGNLACEAPSSGSSDSNNHD
jgi:hypothetical protein